MTRWYGPAPALSSGCHAYHGLARGWDDLRVFANRVLVPPSRRSPGLGAGLWACAAGALPAEPAVNLSTMARAYRELEIRSILTSPAGNGTFVSKPKSSSTRLSATAGWPGSPASLSPLHLAVVAASRRRPQAVAWRRPCPRPAGAGTRARGAYRLARGGWPALPSQSGLASPSQPLTPQALTNATRRCGKSHQLGMNCPRLPQSRSSRKAGGAAAAMPTRFAC
jgi:hypothetical protein